MIQIITKGKICMNREEKNIVIGGIVVSVLVTSGFTLSQGPIGDADDNYNSNSEDIIIAYNDQFDAQELQLKEYGVVQDSTKEIVQDVTQDIVADYTQQYIVEEDIKEEIIIDEEVIENNDTYNVNKAYKKGEIVTYNGIEYKAKWWTKGSYPNNHKDWEEVTNVYEDGSEDYAKGKHYIKGNVVVYEGAKYEAKWWTESTPGSDNSWKIINM